jgi:putative FmdB family regulatory protein
MPRYVYKCYGCQENFEVVHGILEEQAGCPLCFNHVVKRVPQMPHIQRKEVQEDNDAAKNVKRAIEENRALLKDEKKIRVEYKDGN